jgi:hypothetical protein
MRCEGEKCATSIVFWGESSEQGSAAEGDLSVRCGMKLVSPGFQRVNGWKFDL